MIYLSVQPAELYFVWQLEIQLKNFKEIGLHYNDIHVVLGYKEELGRPTMFDHLECMEYARFFYYPDTRGEWSYVSSIRPHLLEKHFIAYPELSTHTIFYHDSDIVFRERLDEERFLGDNNWYLSDTRNYLSDRYLKSFGDDFFVNFCNIVGISPQLVEENQNNTGGAQYVIKSVKPTFWKSVFNDSEKIYRFLNEFNISKTQGKKVQAWCADMWALLWNAWKSGISTRLDDELDFCWPKNHISRWYSTKILHNAGVFHGEKSTYFCKLLFKNSTPYYIDYSPLKKDVCSTVFTKKIKEAEGFQQREVLNELTIFLHIERYSDSHKRTLESYVRYLYKFFDVMIYLIESGSHSRIDHSKIADFCQHKFIGYSSVGTVIMRYTKTRFFFYSSSEILIPANSIKKAFDYLFENEDSLVRPYDSLSILDVMGGERFRQEFKLDSNSGSIASDAHILIESFMMDKKKYVRTGGENLEWNYYLKSGLNLERESRARFFDLRIYYTDSPAFILADSLNLKFEEVKMSIKYYYDRIKYSNKAIMHQDLSLFGYSHPRKIYKSAYQISYPIPVYIIMPNLDREKVLLARKEYYNKKDLFAVRIIDSKSSRDRNSDLWDTIIKIIRNHNFANHEYLIVARSDIEFVESFDSLMFKGILGKINTLGVEYLSLGATGSFDQIRPLSKNLAWIEKCSTLEFLLMSKKLCEKIVEHKYDGKLSVELTISSLALRKVITYPFFTRQKGLDCFDINDIQNQHDRAEHALRYEIDNIIV